MGMATLQALPWRDLTRFVEVGNWFGVLLCLIRINVLADEANINSSATKELAQAQAKHYFGLPEFKALPKEWLSGHLTDRLAELEPQLLNWLHACLDHTPSPVMSPSLAAGRWQALLLDWHALSGSLVPLLGLALMRRHLNDSSDAEHELWRELHALDPAAFWCGLQRVYRFTVPLETVTEVVGAMHTPSKPLVSRMPTRLIYYPAYSNPYQRLLYQAIQADGIMVHPVNELSLLASLMPKPGYRNVIHLHWLNAIFSDPTVEFEQGAEQFLHLLKKLKERGFIIYWTVHNHLSHESPDPDLEAQFRTEVARLVDRV